MILRIVFFIFSFLAVFLFSIENPEVETFSCYAIFVFLNIVFDFFSKVGKSVPIKQLILLIASIQWAIAPILSYHFYTDSSFYYMQIPEAQYMDYIFPALLSFTLGLFIPIMSKSKTDLSSLEDEFFNNRDVLLKRGKFLFYVGLVSIITSPLFPAVISFALFLLSKLIFIGAFYLFALKVKYRYLYLLVAFSNVIISAAQSSVFHDVFLWGGFLFIIYGLLDRIGFFKKVAFVLVGVSVFFFVQLIKQDYRGAINANSSGNRTELLTKVASEKLESDLEQDFGQQQVDRLNQGWIIARIMFVVPTYEPYAEGETIIEGIKSALLPRFLLPNKVVSGGFYFERFTGINLKGTSMNLGLVGEAYANYGESGGIIFMFIFGLCINLFLNIIYNKALISKEYLLWIPFLFLYMVKAEDDFTTMINQFVKAIYVMIGIFVVMNNYFPNQKKLNEE